MPSTVMKAHTIDHPEDFLHCDNIETRCLGAEVDKFLLQRPMHGGHQLAPLGHSHHTNHSMALMHEMRVKQIWPAPSAWKDESASPRSVRYGARKFIR